MQTRADLEARRRRGRERGEQRPGVEALRRDHVARRPERVVEASVGGNRSGALRATHLATAWQQQSQGGDRSQSCPGPISTQQSLIHTRTRL